jgi:hypothetical protein
LVDGRGAVHGCGEPEAFIDGFHHLGGMSVRVVP